MSPGTRTLQFKNARSEDLQDRKLKCTLVPEPDGAASARGLGQTASRTSNMSAGGDSFGTGTGTDADSRHRLEQLERENLRLRKLMQSDTAKQAATDAAKQTPSSSAPPDEIARKSGGGVFFWLPMGLFVALVFVIGAVLGHLYLPPLLD